MFHAPAEVPRVGGGPTRRQCSTDGAPLYRRKLSSYCSCRQCSTVRFANEDCNQQLNPRIFAKLIPRFKGASGASGLLLNTKASQEAACSRAPDAIVPDQEPESHDAGVSRFGENGLHLEAADAAEGHAEQVDGPGSSGNTGTGSHLAATDTAESHAGQVGRSGMSGNAGTGSHLVGADFSNEPGAVLWRHTPPRRTESGLLSYGTASPDSSVQKTALWRTRGSS